MSQPQLTQFFGTTKRGTRAAGKASQKKDATITRRSCRGVKDQPAGINLGVEDVKKDCESAKKEKEDEGTTLDKENSSKDENVCPSPVKRPRRSSKSETTKAAQPLRKGTSRTKESQVEDESIASPSKRSRRGSRRSEAVDEAIELAKNKLTPAQVKTQLAGLKGRNKLAVLREQLKTIQENAKTAEQQAAEEKAREEAAERTKKALQEKTAREATPAHKAFHSLTAKDDGVLPLPYTYSFLAEVFRCTETIAAMLHNRQEVITVEKLKKGVETMTRRNFQLDYLKRIKTVFPAAYQYMWEQMLGKYGKKLNDYELKISVNMDFRYEFLISY